MFRIIFNKVFCFIVKGKEIGFIWFVEVVIIIVINDINMFKDILVISDIIM